MRLIEFDPPYELSRYASALPRTLQPGEDPTPQPPKVVIEFTRAEFGTISSAIYESAEELRRLAMPLDPISERILKIADEIGIDFG